MSSLTNNLAKALFENTKSWPFEEAKRILDRIGNKTPAKGYILLETGYGPSGLPHIGTFGEVARTTMVRHALQQMTDIPVRLFCFSDDMDGLRKVPDNVPNQEMLRQHLNKPLTEVPDPYGKFESFGHHNNAMLRSFLDNFGFEYEFQSSSDWYKSGKFNDSLRVVLKNYDEIMEIMLPSLREERQQTYSPFLPICTKTRHVLQVKIEKIITENDSIVYKDPETGDFVEVKVTDGNCKLQWKADWGMRWHAFNVDYEMSGKDLIDSVKLSSQICKVMGAEPPLNLTYELFLDQEGKKISKSKGNGLTIDEWLTYAPTESLSYYMFQAPKKAKRLYFDVIPRAVDEYLTFLEKYPTQAEELRPDNPVYHIHSGTPPQSESAISFGILLNLASVCNAESSDILWGFVKRYIEGATPESMPFLNKLIEHAVKYYQDFVRPTKQYRKATTQEAAAMLDLAQQLEDMLSNTAEKEITTESLQHVIFEVGKSHGFNELRTWFGCMYEVLLGQKEGPRMGSFVALYGVKDFVNLIKEKVEITK